MSKISRKEKNAQTYSGILCANEYKTVSSRIMQTVFIVICMLLSFICIIPIIWMFLSAFKSTKEFLQIPPTFLPRDPQFGKVAEIWKKQNFITIFTNTIIMAIGDIVFTIVCNGLAGYVLSRLKPRGGRLLFMLIMWTMLLPQNVSQVPLFMTFTDFPLLGINMSNTYWPMWLLAAANCYYILLFKSYFDSLSISYFESAKIDGCSDLRMFFSIVVPLSLPVLVVIAVFQFNAAWGSFFWPYLLLTAPGNGVVGMKIFIMKTQVPIDEYVMAMIYVIIPPALIYLIFQKQIMGGINIGGVKG